MSVTNVIGLQDAHGISEAEKAIFFLDSSLICVHGIIIAHKCRYKHDKRAFWEMKIGDKTVDAFEFISGINKDICITVALGNIAVKRRDAFKSAAGRSSDGNDSSALGFGRVYQIGSFFW